MYDDITRGDVSLLCLDFADALIATGRVMMVPMVTLTLFDWRAALLAIVLVTAMVFALSRFIRWVGVKILQLDTIDPGGPTCSLASFDESVPLPTM